ncbi:hypothetical protein [Nonomuraea recticatena]|uniref:hypothetical protein n=1 Tax=Nonomuraea recticatena TaxID=46178 RepID=UPI003619BA67
MPPDTNSPRRPLLASNSLWRMRSYLRPHIGKLVFIWLVAILGIAASIAFPLVGKEVIDAEQTADLLPSGSWRWASASRKP